MTLDDVETAVRERVRDRVRGYGECLLVNVIVHFIKRACAHARTDSLKFIGEIRTRCHFHVWFDLDYEGAASAGTNINR
jgi:hypothetical protein